MRVAPRPAARHLFAAALALAAVALPHAPTHAQNNAIAEDGLFVAVPNPVTSEAVGRIRNQILPQRDHETRPVRKVVFDFNPDGTDALTTDIGPCLSLAKLIRDEIRLRNVTAVAFVHARVAGHAVLPVLACNELVMRKDAVLGPVAADGVPALNAPDRAAYAFYLDRPPLSAAVQKMYDPDMPLGKGLKNQVDFYVDLRKADEARKEGVVGIGANPLPVSQVGRPGQYSGDQAKALGLCKVTAETADEVAELYQIARLRPDPLQGRAPSAFRYVLRGDVDAGMRESVGRVLTDIKRQKGNVLFLELQCGGPDLQAGRALADELVKHETGDDAVLIVGVVFDQADDAATFVALGCSDIVMSRRKDANDPNRPEDNREAEIGDFGGLLGKAAKKAGSDPGLHRKSLHELAVSQGYPGVLADGMLDPELEILRVRGATDRTRHRLMTREEFEADKANWVVETTVKSKGQLLKLNATRAGELGVAKYVVDNRDIKEVYAAYGLERARVKEATPGWLDRLAEFLRNPAVTILLVLVGFTGLLLEIKVPGLTVPGIVAALCFILVFWSHTQFSGQVAILAGMIFLLGLVLILLEVFVLPGFGAPGVVGILCMLAGLALVTFDHVPQTWDEAGSMGGRIGQYLLAMIGSFVLAFLIGRFLPNIPYANRMMLAPPTDAPGEGETLPGTEEAATLLGAIGTANTVLRPAGVVRFGDKFVDVVSEGGYITAGARVQVVEVEGTRIVVKEV